MGKFTLIVTCKGRLDHLKQTLPRFVRLADTQVVLVDYSCPDKAGDWVEVNFPDVKVVRVEGQKFFNLSAARNAGAAVADSQTLVFCDADTVISDGFGVALGSLADDNFLTFKASAGNSLGGTCAVNAKHFEKVEGFDEVMSNYGGEDGDLYWRLRRLGLNRTYLNKEAASAIPHDTALRVKNYPGKDAGRSFLHSRAYRLVKEAMLGAVFVGELPLEVRRKVWNQVGQAVSDGDFSIRLKLPGKNKSNSLAAWEWEQELTVSFRRKV